MVLERDKLNRERFAFQIADNIKDYVNQDESFAIALYGKWGSGKTWIVDKIIKRIGNNHKDDILCIKFNPWQWNEQQKISKELFKTINIALGKAGKDYKKIARLFKRLSYRLAIYTTAFSSINKLLFGIVVVSFSFNIFFSFTTYLLAKILFWLLEAGSLFFMAVFKVFHNFGSFFSGLDENIDLEHLQKELACALQEQNKKILIIIDDIDRLHANEIQNLIQLIKVNLNLPNIVYLIAGQKNILEN